MDIILFNRVAKSGSEAMIQLIYKLSKLNQYEVRRNKPKKYHNRIWNIQNQKQLINYIIKLKEPSIYIEHVNFINFTLFNLPKPIYINMIRDPIERIISWFYYVRSPWYIVIRKKHFPNLPIKNSDWYKKDFNTCVLSGDPECTYTSYTINDKYGDYRRQSIFFCGHDEDCLYVHIIFVFHLF